MQVNAKPSPEQQLRDLLHVIAATPEPEACITRLLHASLPLTGAAGAAFRLAGTPAVMMTAGDISGIRLDSLPAAAPDFTALNSLPGALVCPVRSSDQLLGVLLLALETLSDDARNALVGLLDALVIAARAANAQGAAANAQRLARALLDSLAEPLLVFDSNWKLLFMNPAAQGLFPGSAGQPLAKVVNSDELVSFAQGQQPLNEWASGAFTFIPRVHPIGEDAEEGWVLAFRDITQFKKLNHSQSEFIRVVSHDVRSPLTAMRGFSDMMGMVGPLNEKQKQFNEKVLSGIMQITTLVDNIQDAGRFDVETGFYEMSREQCDLLEIAWRMVNNILSLTQKTDIEISVSVADEVPIINADKLMLERAVTNLVDNAVKYTPSGGKVEVRIYLAAESVIVSVKDDGLGISPEDQQLLFRRHMRLSRPEHRKIKGSGLGLFIVRSVAQRHGGDAWVESQIGVGTTFSFSIPLRGENLIIPGADVEAR